jgi:hypothetical protein
MRALAIVVACMRVASADDTERRHRFVPVTEAGVLVGGELTDVGSELPRRPSNYPHPGADLPLKFVVQAGLDWKPPCSAWRLGAALYASTIPVTGDRLTGSDILRVGAIARASYPLGSSRLRMGLVFTSPCAHCRSPLQDPDVLLRLGIERSGFALDAELRVTAFDLGRDIRPFGTQVTMHVGASVTRPLPAGIGLAVAAILQVGGMFYGALGRSS